MRPRLKRTEAILFAVPVVFLVLVFAYHYFAPNQVSHKPRNFGGHSSGVIVMAFSASSKHFATGDDTGIVKLWNADDGRLITTFQTKRGPVSAIAISPGGKTVATGELVTNTRTQVTRGAVSLWNVDTGVARPITHGDGIEPCASLSFSPDGRHLAGGHFFGQILLWNVASGNLQHRLKGHGRRDLNNVCYSPDGKFLISRFESGHTVLWKIATGTIIRRFKSAVYAFSPDGDHIASATRDVIPTLTLQRTHTGASVWRVPWNFEDVEASNITGIAFSPDGNSVVSLHYRALIYKRDVLTGAVQQTWSPRSVGAGGDMLSPDGKTAAGLFAGYGSNNGASLWRFEP